MAILDDIEVLVIKPTGVAFPEHDISNPSSNDRYLKKYIEVTANGRFTIELDVHRGYSSNHNLAFAVIRTDRLVSTTIFKVNKPRIWPWAVRVFEQDGRASSFPSSAILRSTSRPVTIQVVVHKFNIDPASKAFDGDNCTFRARLPGKCDDGPPVATFEFVLTESLGSSQATHSVPVAIAGTLAAAGHAEGQRSQQDGSTAMMRHAHSSRDEAQRRSTKRQHSPDQWRNKEASVKSGTTGTHKKLFKTPFKALQGPRSRIAALYETIGSLQAPPPEIGLGGRFKSRSDKADQVKDDHRPAGRAEENNVEVVGQRAHNAAPAQPDKRGKVRPLFDFKTYGEKQVDFRCNVCHEQFGWGHRENHYRRMHKKAPPLPGNEIRLAHVFKGVNKQDWEAQHRQEPQRLPVPNYAEFECTNCGDWLHGKDRKRHYQTHKMLPSRPPTERFRTYNFHWPLDPTMLTFNNGNCGGKLPRRAPANILLWPTGNATQGSGGQTGTATSQGNGSGSQQNGSNRTTAGLGINNATNNAMVVAGGQDAAAAITSTAAALRPDSIFAANVPAARGGLNNNAAPSTSAAPANRNNGANRTTAGPGRQNNATGNGSSTPVSRTGGISQGAVATGGGNNAPDNGSAPHASQRGRFDTLPPAFSRSNVNNRTTVGPSGHNRANAGPRR